MAQPRGPRHARLSRAGVEEPSAVLLFGYGAKQLSHIAHSAGARKEAFIRFLRAL